MRGTELVKFLFQVLFLLHSFAFLDHGQEQICFDAPVVHHTLSDG